MVFLSGARVRKATFRAAVYGLLWWALTEGTPASWLMGCLTVGFAVFVSTFVLDSTSWSWSFRGMIRFIPFFILGSLRAGVDVMRRAIHPRLPINPGLLRYPLRLPTKAARIFMASTVTLMPGTLSAGLGDTHLTVHVLDLNVLTMEQIKETERRVADLFDLELGSPVPGGS